MTEYYGQWYECKSELYPLIRDGVSDMHCMSDAYLAEELEQEYRREPAGERPAGGEHTEGRECGNCFLF